MLINFVDQTYERSQYGTPPTKNETRKNTKKESTIVVVVPWFNYHNSITMVRRTLRLYGATISSHSCETGETVLACVYVV